MRELADSELIDRALSALAGAAESGTRIFLTGGATAVLLGWRDSTIDIDMRAVPETDALLRSIPETKEALRVNTWTTSPRCSIAA